MEQIIWEEARKYLLSFNDITDDDIDQHITQYKSDIPSSMNDVFRGLLGSLTNRQGVVNWIGDLSKLERFYYGYDPRAVVKNYSGWKDLFRTIEGSDYEPPSHMDINDKRNIWVHYCKGVMSGARFLSTFDSMAEFDNAIQNHIKKDRHIDLAHKISKRVHGYGFALSCDFLKGLGYTDFVKPDVHIIDIFNGIGLSRSRKDEDVFRDVVNFSRSIGEVPYAVDKMFWLIGSGNFYLTKKKIGKNKDRFCKMIRERLSEVK